MELAHSVHFHNDPKAGGDRPPYTLNPPNAISLHPVPLATRETDDGDEGKGGRPRPRPRRQRSSPPGVVGCFHSSSARSLIEGTSSLYAMILNCVYLAFVFTELVTFPRYQYFLELNGFFTYLFAASDVFLVYVILVVIRGVGVGENKKVREEIQK